MNGKKIKRYLAVAMLAAGLAFIFLYTRGHQNNKLYRQEHLIMGTFVEVISPEPKAAKIVFDEMLRIEKLLSKYDPQSEVAKLNASGCLKASPETFYAVKRSREFWQASDGAFDITVAALMDLWGFSNRQYRVPKEAEIKKALKLVGSDKIILQEFDNVIQFKLSGMKIDLGAIAKGYALDCASKKLKEAKINSCLINAGGQVFCLGERFKKPWVIGVAGPKNTKLAAYLALKDKVVATSGSAEQYFIKGKKRYCHILNPKTGYPAYSGISSVSVVACDGLTADALATAIFILGKDKGEKLARKFNGAQVKFIQEDNVQNN
ncbi:MAG: FAD:protein FMN transferase [Candidatus Omnitrophota bacterium]